MRIRNISDLIQALTLQQQNLPTYQTEVGATAAEIAEVEEDLKNLDFLEGFCSAVEGNKKLAFAVKQSFFDGDPGTPLELPTFPTPTPPFALVASARDRYDQHKSRWKGAPGYTDEIGLALAIGPDTPAPPDPATVQPTVDVFAAQTGYMYTVVVGNRGESDQWEVMVQPKGANAWSSAGTFTGKSADITYVPATPGDPVALTVRIQLKRKNANYGQLSDMVAVTVNP